MSKKFIGIINAFSTSGHRFPIGTYQINSALDGGLQDNVGYVFPDGDFYPSKMLENIKKLAKSGFKISDQAVAVLALATNSIDSIMGKKP